LRRPAGGDGDAERADDRAHQDLREQDRRRRQVDCAVLLGLVHGFYGPGRPLTSS
jgi:hypothetical protein